MKSLRVLDVTLTNRNLKMFVKFQLRYILFFLFYAFLSFCRARARAMALVLPR